MINKCGSCQVCCEVLRIDEISKPAHSRCTNQVKTGCKIYESRPNSCKVYQCEWLKNGEPEDNRPDRLGILFSERFTEDNKWVTMHVINPKARSLERVKKKILNIINKTVLIEMNRDEMVLLGGPEAEVIKMLRSNRYQIDWWEAEESLYFLRPTVLNDIGEVFSPTWGGRCVFLTDNGCKLSWEDRPYGCKALVPNASGKCKSSYGKFQCAKEWEACKELIDLEKCGRLVRGY